MTEATKQGEISEIAAAIANARGMRRGAPPITNVLDLLPEKILADVMDDARAVCEVIDPELSAIRAALQAAEERAQKATEAVRKYAWHQPGCPGYLNSCTCGLSEVLRELEG